MDFEKAVSFARATIQKTTFLKATWHRSFEERAEAAATDPVAFQLLLNDLAHLIADNEPLSDLQRVWLTKYLRGLHAMPVPRGRRKAPEHAFRAASIVSDLVQKGMKPYRNDLTKVHSSACDAVAEALRLEGLTPNSYDGVSEAYRKSLRRASLHKSGT